MSTRAVFRVLYRIVGVVPTGAFLLALTAVMFAAHVWELTGGMFDRLFPEDRADSC